MQINETALKNYLKSKSFDMVIFNEIKALSERTITQLVEGERFVPYPYSRKREGLRSERGGRGKE